VLPEGLGKLKNPITASGLDSATFLSLGLPQPLTEMGARNFPWGKGLSARKADIFTAICEPTV
jgi:hypothetical protein